MPEIDNMKWLQSWFFETFESKPAKEDRLTIRTIDNPGWRLSINLEDTFLYEKILEPQEREVNDNDWVHFWIKDGVFQSAGGAKNLGQMLGIFRRWVETGSYHKSVPIRNVDIISWLESWYETQCDGRREHSYGMRIKASASLSWTILIDLNETQWQDLVMPKLNISRSDQDWLVCEISDKKFSAKCGPDNLSEALSVFKKWIIQAY